MADPICYECGVKVEMGERGFYVCPNCALDLETDYMNALWRLHELMNRAAHLHIRWNSDRLPHD